ncbi:hypothetical protein DRE_04464 [Drechslerella stenobrocha 248]|uniref:Phosphoribosylglycinamide formyltransferase n=1 Tax=Drechslerella stenobrocha 248 TaxID=1043628 RepID=W7I201_9PEZI|nr:hypothetical protein DRE_04464 [Drechslerella stenobrocha 248]
MASRIVVLISGSGSNLQALIDSASTSSLPSSRIVHVVSNRKAAYGLTRAASSTPPIPTSYHGFPPYKTSHPSDPRAAYDADLAKRILELPEDQYPDLIVCAGWMHILSPNFLDPISEAGIPIINLHPALPGAFDGAGAIERAWEAFSKGEITETGVMIHYVIKEVDRGEPLVVKKVEMKAGESVEELTARIHDIEHVAIVEGAKLALEKKNSGCL